MNIYYVIALVSNLVIPLFISFVVSTYISNGRY